METILPPGIQRELKFHFNAGSSVQASPYFWDEVESMPQLSLSKFRSAVWKINCCIIFTNFSFGVVRCIQINEDPVSPIWLKVYMQFNIALFFIPVLPHLAGILKTSQFMTFMKHLISFLRIYEGIPEFAGHPERKKLVKINLLALRFIRGIITMNVCLFTLNALLRPESPEFITSLWLPEKYPLAARILQILNFLIWAVTARAVTTLYICTLSNFAICLLIVFKEISHNTSHHDISQIEKKISIYHQIEILVKECNDVFGDCLLSGAKLLLICICVLSYYGAVRFHGVLAITLAIFGLDCTILLLLIFTCLAVISKRSEYALRSFTESLHLVRSPTKKKLLRKYLRSLIMQKIVVGNMYFVDKFMVLTLGKTIFDSTVDFLLCN